MHTAAPQIPLSVPPILPRTLRPWAEPLTPALHRILIPTEVMDSFENARHSGTGARFARRLIESLDIRFRVDDGDLERIPARGPAILVANHPYGIVEGLILMALMDRVRQDLKILANSLLGGIPELREQMILVNPFQTPTAKVENRAPLRAALDWLAGGGLLSVFPAGEGAAFRGAGVSEELRRAAAPLERDHASGGEQAGGAGPVWRREHQPGIPRRVAQPDDGVPLRSGFARTGAAGGPAKEIPRSHTGQPAECLAETAHV